MDALLNHPVVVGALWGLAAAAVIAGGYLGYPRWKKLTAMGKCVVLSIAVHLLLLALMSRFQWPTPIGYPHPRVRLVPGGFAEGDDQYGSDPRLDDVQPDWPDEIAEDAEPEDPVFYEEEARPDAESAREQDDDPAAADLAVRQEPQADQPNEVAAAPPTTPAPPAPPASSVPQPLDATADESTDMTLPPLLVVDDPPEPSTTSEATQPDPQSVAAVDATSGRAPPDAAREATGTAPVAVAQPQAAGGAPIEPIYSARVDANRMAQVLAGGGDEQTEAAVKMALAWLASVQQPDGSWDPRRFGAGQAIEDSQRPRAGWTADTGITGLATLCFLAAGHTHLEGNHRIVVQRALEYLLSQQSPTGSLSGPAGHSDAMYCHGMATLAVSEAYAMTKDARLQDALSRALSFTVRVQDPVTGGWRYTARQPGDMSQHGWQLMCLASGRHAGFQIPAQSFQRASRFIDSVSHGRHGGLAAYQANYRAPTPAMTAEALFCRMMTTPPSPATIDEAARYLLEDLPGGPSPPNFYYWYYATLALYQVQGDPWDVWNRAMKLELLTRQITSGPMAGSWEPNDVYGRHGGRIYSTALATLCLEVYYRYLPLTVQVADWNRQYRR